MSKKYSRRYDDVKISIIPQWMDKTLAICKYLLYVIPFLCCSIAMFIGETTLSQSYLLTAVYCLSLLKLIEMADK